MREGGRVGGKNQKYASVADIEVIFEILCY